LNIEELKYINKDFFKYYKKSINNNISLKKDKGKGSREDYNLKDFIDMEKLKAVFGNDVSLSNIIVPEILSLPLYLNVENSTVFSNSTTFFMFGL
jgi:hypothetical protein